MLPKKLDESILQSITEALGLDKDDTVFNPDIAVYVNGAISEINQAGVGTEVFVVDKETKWSDLIIDKSERVSQKLIGEIMLYVFLKVKILFDPPAVNTQNVMVQAADQAIWRLAASWDEATEDRSDSKGGD